MMADRKRVEPLLRTARGQLEGVLRMIDENRYCMDIVTQLQAVESLVHKAQREVLRAHLNGCVRDAFENGDEQAREQKIDEIIKLIDKSKAKKLNPFCSAGSAFSCRYGYRICFSAAMSASICSSVPTVIRR